MGSKVDPFWVISTWKAKNGSGSESITIVIYTFCWKFAKVDILSFQTTWGKKLIAPFWLSMGSWPQVLIRSPCLLKKMQFLNCKYVGGNIGGRYHLFFTTRALLQLWKQKLISSFFSFADKMAIWKLSVKNT